QRRKPILGCGWECSLRRDGGNEACEACEPRIRRHTRRLVSLLAGDGDGEKLCQLVRQIAGRKLGATLINPRAAVGRKRVTAPRIGIFVHDSLVRYPQRLATTGRRGELFRRLRVPLRDGESRPPPALWHSAPPGSSLSSGPRRSHSRQSDPRLVGELDRPNVAQIMATFQVARCRRPCSSIRAAERG